ncbi:MAG: hypothetical protein ACM3Q9_00720, partial [Methanosarcina sp.]
MTGRALGIAFAVSLLTLTMGAAGAAANTASIIEESDPAHPAVTSGWQAGTCNAEPPEPGAETCSVATPDQFFEMAGAHPNWGFTQFIVRHGPPPTESPVGEVKTIRVDLPVGLSVNPGATERCPLVVFESGAANCESTHPGSRVGESLVTVAAGPGPLSPVPVLTQVPVYNVEPKAGEAARFGLELAGNEVFLEGDVDWSGDYHEGFTIHVPAALPEDLAPLLGLVGQNGVILKNRLIFNGRSGDETFLTTPTTCFGPAYQAGWVEGEQPTGPSGSIYSTFLRASSVQEEEEPGYVFPQSAEPALESPIPPESAEGGPTEPKDCDTIPYEPSLAVDPGTEEANSPAPARVDIEVPHLLPDYGAEEREQDSSHTKQATVTLPVGMGINPSAATGLQVCSDAEFGKGTANPVACPPASIIGHAKIESPPLTDELEPQPEEALEGNVYVGRQLSRDPASGDEYRIFIEAKSDRYGISVRLVGKVKADPVTGQLSTTISETPQVPFTSFDLTFNGGPHAVLSSPPTCGPNNSSAVMTPWSGNSPATPSDGFTLSRAPGGGKCAKTLAERPFGPGFAAGPASAKAGAFSPVSMQIVRSDGQQELKGADITLPPGMTGKLAGIPYCPESARAAPAADPGARGAAPPRSPPPPPGGTATRPPRPRPAP